MHATSMKSYIYCFYVGDAGRLTWKNLKKGRHSIYLKAFCIDNQIEKYSIMRKRYKFRIREDEFIRLYAH